MVDIKEKLAKIEERIKKAVNKAGRNREDIKLLAVSKKHSIEKIKAVAHEGIVDFGESRVQELEEKNEKLEEDIVWHMVGHLQRNKVKYLARIEGCKLIHSVDSLRLAKRINKRARLEDRSFDILLQVNTAQDENKYGLDCDQVIELLEEMASLKYINVKGLMTIAPYSDDPEEVRPYFRKLKELALKVEKREIPSIEMKELSMGMTNDLEVAIEEGATIIRVGRGIFGEREY